MPIFDGHNDTLTELQGRSFFEESQQGHLDLPRARRGGMIGGFYAIYAPPPPDSPESDPYYGLTITGDGYMQQMPNGSRVLFGSLRITATTNAIGSAHPRLHGFHARQYIGG